MNKRLFCTIGIILLLIAASLQAQTSATPKENNKQPQKDVQPKAAPQAEQDDSVVMLEEIIIKVTPELPTVVMTIPRQKPEIKPVSIQSPVERMVSLEDHDIKPDLSKMKINKVEELDKMLAQQRVR